MNYEIEKDLHIYWNQKPILMDSQIRDGEIHINSVYNEIVLSKVTAW